MSASCLLDHLTHVMSTYLAEVDKLDVVEASKSETKMRIHKVRAEVAKLSDVYTTSSARDHREKQLMRFCQARLRVPQRLTKLTLIEERGRWLTTLHAYDRVLFEAMDEDFLGG